MMFGLEAQVPVLLSLSRIDAQIPLPPTAQRVNLDTDWGKIADYPKERPADRRSHANGLAYIIFTSGSTGRPKGTLLQHSGLINYLYYLIRYIRQYLQSIKRDHISWKDSVLLPMRLTFLRNVS